MPKSINYGRVIDVPGKACEDCGLMVCNHITSKKVKELGDLLSYLRTEHNVNEDKIRMARRILKNTHGKKANYFKRNLEGRDIKDASSHVLRMIGED